MSTWFVERVTCPACHMEQDARLAHGVHASRAPEVREQVLSRTFHRITCTACSMRFVVNRELVYTDMDRRQWLQVGFTDHRPRWPELETMALRTFERAFIGSPLAAELRERFKVRLVFGVEELREKLAIWRAGLDDAVVECAKLMMCARLPELALIPRLIVDTIDDKGLTVSCVDVSDAVTSQFVISNSVMDDLSDRHDELVRYLPELFSGTFVSTYRLLGHRYRLPSSWQ